MLVLECLANPPSTIRNRARRGRNDTDATRYPAEAWRQIEEDWLGGAAGELALQLDAHTNNTSLMLAVELSRGGRVLLFPGDAQVGNWLSWDAVRWSGAGAGVTAEDLLARTVLYKVGHHGSHNTTLRQRGLESMTSRDLVALVPVDRRMAELRRWRMPHPPLYQRLQELTQGRVVLADAGSPAAKPRIYPSMSRCGAIEALAIEIEYQVVLIDGRKVVMSAAN